MRTRTDKYVRVRKGQMDKDVAALVRERPRCLFQLWAPTSSWVVRMEDGHGRRSSRTPGLVIRITIPRKDAAHHAFEPSREQHFHEERRDIAGFRGSSSSSSSLGLSRPCSSGVSRPRSSGLSRCCKYVRREQISPQGPAVVQKWAVTIPFPQRAHGGAEAGPLSHAGFSCQG